MEAYVANIIPQTAKEARTRGYKKHTEAEKAKHVLLTHNGATTLVRAATAQVPQGPHTVCYYDPGTKAYSNCHDSP
jgi:hypothetical protein